MLIALPLVMVYKDKLWARVLFLGSAYFASIGPFFGYYMYILWNIFDYLLKDHKRSDLFITLKTLFFMAYAVVSTWFIGDLISGVREYYDVLYEESKPEAL